MMNQLLSSFLDKTDSSVEKLWATDMYALTH